MTTESSSSRANSTADSYIGSLISLTSKSEIRYEGVLYNINTEESSIGLRNVRSFGTEGRKKDGPQVPPSDKVYEYILFRGSDIKDLQVKSSPPAQPAPPINNDPAIIQSHYPRPVTSSTSLPSATSGSLTDAGSNTTQMALPASNFQGGLPLYQPGGSIGSWGASPAPSANNSGIMPMYWQGYYGTPNGLPHINQQPLLRPPPGLSMPPPLQQPLQYPGFNTSFPSGPSNLPGSLLPDVPVPLLPVSSSSLNVTSNSSSSTLPLALSSVPSTTVSPDSQPSSMPNKALISILPTVSLSANLPSLPPLVTTTQEISSIAPPLTSKANAIVGSALQFQSTPQPTSSILGPSNAVNLEASTQTATPTPSLVTPGQLLQLGSTTIPSSQPSQIAHKDVEVVQVSPSSPKPLVPVVSEAQPPILPLPPPARGGYKQNGAPFQARYGHRGRGRGARGSRPITRFTEDFDFMAMNEKFNKDEVWGHLGKSSKSHSKDKEGDGELSDEDNYYEEEDNELPKLEVKPVYNKDDFFDTLSCNALDHESNSGRTRFSEQMKIDTETFGDFPRHRGGRGGRGPMRGGRGRGYYGRGYGSYAARGRGRTVYGRAL